MPTTAEILAECRIRDREEPAAIVICSNVELLTGGVCERHHAEEVADAFTSAAHEVIETAARGPWDSATLRFRGGLPVRADTDRIFARWQGGRHAKCGGLVGAEPWGYSAGYVVCHERTCPAWLRELVDRAAGAGHAARAAAAERLAEDDDDSDDDARHAD